MPTHFRRFTRFEGSEIKVRGWKFLEVEATDNIGTTRYCIRDREDRDVYFIKWGRTPSSSFIFYYALLFSNETPSRTPTTTVQGFTFSWAMENREFIKHCPAVLSSPLTCVKELGLKWKFFLSLWGIPKVPMRISCKSASLLIGTNPLLPVENQADWANYLHWQHWAISGRGTIFCLTIARWSPGKKLTKWPGHCRSCSLLLTLSSSLYAWRGVSPTNWNRARNDEIIPPVIMRSWIGRLIGRNVQPWPSVLSCRELNYMARSIWHIHCLCIMNLTRTTKDQDTAPILKC